MTKRSSTILCPQPLEGTATWFYADREPDKFQVKSAVLRTRDELVIDCDCGAPGKPYSYTIELRRTSGDIFCGTFTGGPRLHSTKGTVLCTVAISADDCNVKGQWHENGRGMDWLAELFPVQRSDSKK